MKSLKSFLGTRGVKTSTSILATSLATLGTESAKAATVAQIATFALQQTPIKTVGLSLSALAAGFLATSAIAVGLRSVTPTPEHNPVGLANLPTKSLRSSTPPPTFSSLSPPVLEDDSFESIIAAVKELSRRPQHEITHHFLRDLLDQISDAQIPAFIEASKDSFSQAERVVYYILLNRWGESNPEEAVTYALHEDISTLLGKESGLVNGLVYQWAESEPVQALNWVLDEWSHSHWEAVWAMGGLRVNGLYTGDFHKIETVVERMLDQLRSEKSIGGFHFQPP